MAKEPKGELVVVEANFDYSPLGTDVAERVRTAADRIRQHVKRTIESIIEVGNELLAVREALPHGKIGPWLRAEFGWTERTARNFMSVAESFGGKLEIISDLAIDPTAAYLLAAPSAPEAARETALERAGEGQRITTSVAKEILASARKKAARKVKALPAEKLSGRLVKVLSRFKDRWDPKDVSELARQLREFADALEEGKGRGRKGTRKNTT